EALLEAGLNERVQGTRLNGVEILNLGVPGYRPPQQLVAFDKALRFAPDGVIYIAVGRELSQAARHLASVAIEGRDIPYPFLADIAARAGLKRGMDETEAQRRLQP